MFVLVRSDEATSVPINLVTAGDCRVPEGVERNAILPRLAMSFLKVSRFADFVLTTARACVSLHLQRDVYGKCGARERQERTDRGRFEGNHDVLSVALVSRIVSHFPNDTH